MEYWRPMRLPTGELTPTWEAILLEKEMHLIEHFYLITKFQEIEDKGTF